MEVVDAVGPDEVSEYWCGGEWQENFQNKWFTCVVGRVGVYVCDFMFVRVWAGVCLTSNFCQYSCIIIFSIHSSLALYFLRECARARARASFPPFPISLPICPPACSSSCSFSLALALALALAFAFALALSLSLLPLLSRCRSFFPPLSRACALSIALLMSFSHAGPTTTSL